MKDFIVGMLVELYHRVILSYRSTFLGLAVVAIGEALNYAILHTPDPRVHWIVTLLFTIFTAWKDKKVAEGAAKLIPVLILFTAIGASAQGNPRARTNAQGVADPNALAGAVAEDPNAVQPGATVPTPSKYGGCLKSGSMCFGPSVSVSMLALNLSKATVEGAFSPGVGYGFTYKPGQWDSIGADVYFVLDPGAQQASMAIVLKLVNGFFRFGVSKGFIGDTSWRIPVGLGVDL